MHNALVILVRIKAIVPLEGLKNNGDASSRARYVPPQQAWPFSSPLSKGITWGREQEVDFKAGSGGRAREGVFLAHPPGEQAPFSHLMELPAGLSFLISSPQEEESRGE